MSSTFISISLIIVIISSTFSIKGLIADDDANSISWPDILQGLISLECQQNGIELTMIFDEHSDEITEALWETIVAGRLCIVATNINANNVDIADVDDAGCCSSYDSARRILRLTVDYERCGIVTTDEDSRRNNSKENRPIQQQHRAKILFDSYPNANASYAVECQSLVRAGIASASVQIIIVIFEITIKYSYIKPGQENSQSSDISTLFSLYRGNYNAINQIKSNRNNIVLDDNIVTLNVGNTVYGEVQVQFNSFDIKDLYTYPVQCWTSTDMNDDHGQSPITDQQSLSLNTNRSYFINGGCPNLDANNRGMATLTQSTDNRRRRTRFSFTITDAFIPKNAIKRSSTITDIRNQQQSSIISPIYIHCNILVCSGSQLTGIQDIPNCPKSAFCNGNSQITHRLPQSLRKYASRHVVAGPLAIAPKSSSHNIPIQQQHSTMIDDIDCQRHCAKTINRQSKLLSTNNQQNIPTTIESVIDSNDALSSIVFVESGISTWSAIIIAFMAFTCGMIFVAALWIVHVKTEPKHQSTKSPQINRNSPSSLLPILDRSIMEIDRHHRQINEQQQHFNHHLHYTHYQSQFPSSTQQQIYHFYQPVMLTTDDDRLMN